MLCTGIVGRVQTFRRIVLPSYSGPHNQEDDNFSVLCDFTSLIDPYVLFFFYFNILLYLYFVCHILLSFICHNIYILNKYYIL
jgi:hypothetical protein